MAHTSSCNISPNSLQFCEPPLLIVLGLRNKPGNSCSQTGNHYVNSVAVCLLTQFQLDKLASL